MTVRKSSKVVNNLEKKGFIPSDSHHKFFYFYIDGKDTGIWTKISQGSNHDLDEYLLHKMAKQVKLPFDRFLDLIDCPMSKDEYIDYLRMESLV